MLTFLKRRAVRPSEPRYRIPSGMRVYAVGDVHDRADLLKALHQRLVEDALSIGARSTMNYRVSVPHDVSAARRASKAREAMPEAHLFFLRLLQTSFVLDNSFFVHAGVRPKVPLSLRLVEALLWIRNGFLSADTHYEARIVDVHSIVKHPEVLPHQIGLDTGACSTGVLSCAVLEEDHVRILCMEDHAPQGHD